VPEPFILPARCVYSAGSFNLVVEVAYLDMLAKTFMRGPGETVGTFALGANRRSHEQARRLLSECLPGDG
jgi:CO/xanthine dehydrogenase Mo-binding subunit